VTPVPTVFSPNSNVTIKGDALEVGAFVGVVLQGTGVFTWGSDPYGQGGFGGAVSPGTSHFDLRMLPGLPAIKAISNRGLATLLLDTTGSVWALGLSDYGMVGNGVFANGMCPLQNGQQCENGPVKLAKLSNVVQITTGMFNSGAITQDGKLWMWGSNFDATLGHPPSLTVDGVCQGTSLACSPTPVVVTVVP
jgi:alpha-tubulin suppressor-like RCC1 family protein